MSGYRDFSAFYDRLMTEVDYGERADYLLSLFSLHDGKTPESLLDVACGSGSLCRELVGRGVDMIGVDSSAAMLAEAMRKTDASQNILFLQQDMRALDLYGTVNGAVCIMDSLNHLCKTADIACFLQRLRLFVEPGGLFVFDVNTPYKHRHLLADNAFVFEKEDFVCVWQNSDDPKTGITVMDLDFFAEDADGRYTRFSDTVKECAYSERTLRRLLSENGWECLALYGDKTVAAPSDTCDRWVFVARNTRTVREALGE